jgi:hypothetical protein
MAVETVAAIGMGVNALFQGIAGLFGASSEAEALRKRGEYEKAIYDQNARFSELQADDAIRRGSSEALRLRGEGRKIRGAQRASYAGQGVDVNAGAAVDVGEGTELAIDLDADTIKTNAWREAWGYRVQASESRQRGNLAKAGADRAAGNTLLTGGLKAIGYGLQGAYSFGSIGGGGGRSGGGNYSVGSTPSAVRFYDGFAR